MAFEICRICLEKNDKILDIFGEEGYQRNIKGIVAQHFWFQIEEDDVESKNICMICWEKIENFHSFYTEVYDAHNSLKQNNLLFVETENIKLENDEPGLADYNVFENVDEDRQPNPTIKIESNDVSIKSEESDASIADFSEEDDYDIVPPTKKKGKIVSKVSGKPSVKNSKPLKKVNISSKKTDEESGSENEKIKKKDNSSTKKTEEEFEAENVKIRQYYSMKCELCDTTFLTFADVRTHYRKAHNMIGYLKCCEKKLSCRRRVMDHIQWHINPFRCEVCGRTFTEKRFLDNHVDNIHRPEKRTFKCDQCPRTFIKPYLMVTHRKIFHEQKEVIECRECNKRFTQKVSLYSHMRNIHGTEEYVCDICAQVFKNKTNFDYHMKHKHGDIPVELTRCQCQICGAWLKTKSIYQKHLKDVHCDLSKKYICNVCGKECPTEGALRSHRNYHKLTRRYKCEFCDKAYKVKYLLKEHMTSHTGEVLYSCPFCPRTLNSSANLYAHKKREHPQEWAESKNKQ